MKPSRGWLLLSFLLLAACQTISPDRDTQTACNRARFDLPIMEAADGTKIYVLLHLGSFGPQRVTLDSGAGANVKLTLTPTAEAASQARDQQVFLKPGVEVSVEEISHLLYFSTVYVSPKVLEMAHTMQISEFIANPNRIDVNGYVVVNLRRHRLFDFATAAEVRDCVGQGTRSQITAAERADNYVFIDTLIDGKLAGRVEIDTGQNSTEFYNVQLRDQNAAPSDQHHYRIGGNEVIARLSRNHEIKIGNTTKAFPVVEDVTDHPVNEPVKPDAHIGYAALHRSVLIFPPTTAGYWELIF